MVILENIDIDIVMDVLENIDIDIDKGILQNIYINKISYQLEYGISNRASQQKGVMCKVLCVCVPFGPRVGGCMSVGVYIGIVYILPTIGGYMSVCVYIAIGYTLPTIGRNVSVGIYIKRLSAIVFFWLASFL